MTLPGKGIRAEPSRTEPSPPLDLDETCLFDFKSIRGKAPAKNSIVVPPTKF